MQHLLEKYPEATINDNRVIPATPEKRLVKALYDCREQRDALSGQASRYITIEAKGSDKFIPVFDSRYQADVAAMHSRIVELDKLETDLTAKINLISEKFETDIRSLHEERRGIEEKMKSIGMMFPAELEALRVRHRELNDLITEYTAILGPDI